MTLPRGELPVPHGRALELFTAAWNTNDAKTRERLVRTVCSPGLEVTSPYGILRGIGAQLRSIAEVRAQFPRLRTRGTILGEHHGAVLSSWRTSFGGARPALSGIDCYEFDGQGRVVRVVSFSPVSLSGTARGAKGTRARRAARTPRRRGPTAGKR